MTSAYVICSLVADLPIPHVASSRTTCECICECRAPIWRAQSQIQDIPAAVP